ncbi:carbohydrate ABC transporter permease [Agromyces sp. NPDC058484]|uniref:carbohydrate ABC transporter permease n=1 Tax=Agromyces sp. NPDC058484 TaxID=3346524 RepID=UPI003664B1AB
MSLTDMSSRDTRNPLNVNVVGFENYIELLADPVFVRSALNTLLYVGVSVPVTLALALALALAVNSGITRFRTVVKVGFYLPFVTSIVGISVMWRFILAPDSGLLNEALALFGVGGQAWLQNEGTALPSLIFIVIWRNVGMIMIVFLAGLQDVPHEMLEAGRIDGANAWQRFYRLTLPMLRPTTLFAAVAMSLWVWQVFEEPYVMTRGGPLDSTSSLSLYAFEEFGFGNYGSASAASYVLFVGVLAGVILLFRLLRPKT